MRFLVLLFVVVVGYLLYVRSKPAPTATEPSSTAVKVSSTPAQPPQQSNVLKRPIDRTREVMKGVEERGRVLAFSG